MSTIAEKARAEAERAEAEEPDEQEPETPEAPSEEPEEPEEPAAPPAEPLTPERVEKRHKAAAKAQEAYLTKITAALGPEIMAGFVASPLDTYAGLVEVDQNGQPHPQIKADTLAFLAQEPPPDWKQNQAMQTCKRCNGYGDLLTGSKRKGNELTMCPDCGGLGYTDPQGMRVGAQTLSAVPAPVGNGAPLAPSPESHGMGDPDVARLRAAGYTILEPIHVG